MDQSVMVFGGSAARSSAIGTANFEEGMVSYLTDTDKVEAYNGTNWVSVAPTTSQGLTLINTTSFSAVASHSLATNTFSSTYTNYRIVFDYIYGSANALLRLRYRKAGTDNTSSIYYSGVHFTNWSGVAGVSTSSAAATSSAILSLSTVTGSLTLDISQPLVRPMLTGMAMQAGPEDRGVYISAYINGSDTFDSLTLFPASGTITGSYSVYGLNKA